jgi:hypothetical protein
MISIHGSGQAIGQPRDCGQAELEREFCPFGPNDRLLKALLTGTVPEGFYGRELAGGGLLGRVPKVG